MQLKKKITTDTLASACYTSDGLALRLSGKDDNFMNSIALVEYVDGKLRLTLFDDAIERYGIEVAHENVNPNEW
jgi:hypothetical protein